MLYRLSDSLAADQRVAGGKGAALARMASAGLAVPDGFVVSTGAYAAFLAEAGLRSTIRQALRDAREEATTLAGAARRIREAFLDAEVPGALRERIAAALAELGPGPVAVRSSATAEDQPEASFAGQQETFLHVEGPSAVAEAVRDCWASAWSERAIAYREAEGMPAEDVAMAVVVQRMVRADAAGVAFSADPRSGRRDRVVVEAAAGTGEAVVGGRVAPQRWVLDSSDLSIVEPPGPGRQGAPVLGEDQLQVVARLASDLAGLFGRPQDIEWALDGRTCWLLQSRPITALMPLPEPRRGSTGPQVWLSLNLVGQGVAEPFTPMGIDFLRCAFGYWPAVWSSRPRDVLGLGVSAGRMYADITPLLTRPRLRDWFVARVALREPETSRALAHWLSANADRIPAGRRPSAAALAAIMAALGRLLPGVARSLVAPERERRRLIRRADREIARAQRAAASVQGVLPRVRFTHETLSRQVIRVVVDQLPAVLVGIVAAVSGQALTRRWLGDDREFAPILEAIPFNPTTEMGLALWRVAQTGPDEFDEAMRGFLLRYGHRAVREIDIGVPRWSEDPGYVDDLVRGYQRAGIADPAQRFARAERHAEETERRLVAAVRRRRGRARALTLRVLIRRTRALAGLRERPKFDMIRLVAIGRRTLRDAGRALRDEGRVDVSDDVFFLSRTDLAASGDLRAIVDASRRDYRRELRHRAAPRLLTSDGEAIYTAPAAGAAPEGTLTGTGVSHGVHEGRARIVADPDKADLRPGDVLVATSTDPAWTPLFLTAGGLVMEVGGLLSHGSVVAREYGVPAVVGVAGATTLLRDGDLVTVDGDHGTVSLPRSVRDPGDGHS